MRISREYHAHSGNYNVGGNSCRYIVVHNTGNVANARAEARFAQNDQHPSSYHYVLDGNECFQILDDTDTAWAVGAWAGAYQIIGNRESVSIEVCSNGTEFTSQEIRQLTELVGILMDRWNIPAERVVRHYDCHSGHKDCPAFYVNQSRWNALWSVITSGIIKEDEVDMSMACIIQPNGKNYLVYYDGVKAHPLAHPDEVNAIQMVAQATLGKKIPQFALGKEGAPWATRFKNAIDRDWKTV